MQLFRLHHPIELPIHNCGKAASTLNNLTLFKCTDNLGDRLQTLLNKKKADTLTSEKDLELEVIGELDEILRVSALGVG